MKNTSCLRGCAGSLLLALAILWSFLALIGRADSMEDVARGKIADWIILGPLWAGFIFISSSSVLIKKPRGWIIAALLAIATWITVALVFNWWEDEKVRIRMGPIEERLKEAHQERDLEHHAGG